MELILINLFGEIHQIFFTAKAKRYIYIYSKWLTAHIHTSIRSTRLRSCRWNISITARCFFFTDLPMVSLGGAGATASDVVSACGGDCSSCWGCCCSGALSESAMVLLWLVVSDEKMVNHSPQSFLDVVRCLDLAQLTFVLERVERRLGLIFGQGGGKRRQRGASD